MQVLVIIPTYNEYENLPRIVSAVLAIDPSLSILVVDDNSPDGTGKLAEQLASGTERLHVLHRPGKQGLGTAYIAGFTYGLAHGYSHMVEMDADFSHRPEDLPRLLAAAETADVVVGSRNIPGGRTEHWSLPRRLISAGGSLYTRAMLGLPVQDCTSGFKCFSRSALAALDLSRVQSSGFGFQVEMNVLCHQQGLRIVEVPITFPDRQAGRSKMSMKIFLEALLLVAQLRLQARGAARRVHVPLTGQDVPPVSNRRIADATGSTARAPYTPGAFAKPDFDPEDPFKTALDDVKDVARTSTGGAK